MLIDWNVSQFLECELFIKLAVNELKFRKGKRPSHPPPKKEG